MNGNGLILSQISPCLLVQRIFRFGKHYRRLIYNDITPDNWKQSVFFLEDEVLKGYNNGEVSFETSFLYGYQADYPELGFGTHAPYSRRAPTP